MTRETLFAEARALLEPLYEDDTARDEAALLLAELWDRARARDPLALDGIGDFREAIRTAELRGALRGRGELVNVTIRAATVVLRVLASFA